MIDSDEANNYRTSAASDLHLISDIDKTLGEDTYPTKKAHNFYTIIMYKNYIVLCQNCYMTNIFYIIEIYLDYILLIFFTKIIF